MTGRRRSLISGLVLAFVLAAIPSARAAIVKNHDRKFPVGAYCPIESRAAAGADLSFTPTGSSAQITFRADNMIGQCQVSSRLCFTNADCGAQDTCVRFCGADFVTCQSDADCNPGDRCGEWNHFRLDNVTVVPKSVFDQHLLAPSPFYENCYDDTTVPPGQLLPGVAEVPSFDFNAAGTASLNRFFDTPAGLAGWTGDVYFDVGDPAPRNPSGPNYDDLDLTGGGLSIGQIQDGTRPVSASLLVGGLTPGVPYVVFGWWSINFPSRMTITIETGCPDLDGDGRAICSGGCVLLPGQVCGDCNDTKPHCAASCVDGDGDGWCTPNDCNDAVASCNQDCTSDVDGDARIDCLDSCIDPDRDGYGQPGGGGFSCTGVDCLEGNSSCNADCTDNDADGYCPPADCADGDDSRYPNAPEINDCTDQQCPGNPGFGVIDETSGLSDFKTQTVFRWPAQAGASQYQVVRSNQPTFPGACAGTVTTGLTWSDLAVPPRGGAFYYLDRPIAPCLGSWGQNSAGVERTSVCTGEICGNGLDDDHDGAADCLDVDCAGSPACQTAVFSFVDTAADDIPDTALFDFFQSHPAGLLDYILFQVVEPGQTAAWCSQNAAYYRNTYLSSATTGGFFLSGSWQKWHRSMTTGNAWVGPDTTGHSNSYGYEALGTNSWCSEEFPFDMSLCVIPGLHDYCEVADAAFSFDCNQSTQIPWTLTIRTASSRQAACGF
ncbi:MAG TPA: hypothetical protein VN898_01285 [Candidatus Binatia bacterium]|nr:hypothetical protein [Candidatus Binatia bacterium]